MIPFVDLKAQYRRIKDEVDAAIRGILDTCQFTLGSEVAAFEKEFAAYSQVDARHRREHRHQRAAPGAARRRTSAKATRSSPSRSPSWPRSRPSTTRGATPVFVDIDPAHLHDGPGRRSRRRSRRETKAIMPGAPVRPAAPTWIRSWRSRRKHKLVVIEDACQAHGAEYKGRRAGSIGDMGCFSFYPGKNLGAYGEGGMVVTNNAEYARTIRMLRDWGAEKKYQHVLKGYNYRMEGIQGAVLRVKLQVPREAGPKRAARPPRVTTQLVRRQRRAARPRPCHTPARLSHLRHPHAASARVAGRAAARRASQTGIHYPIPVHLLPAFADLGYHAGQFPHSERAASEVLSLPMFPELTAQQCETVSAAVAEVAGGASRPRPAA